MRIVSLIASSTEIIHALGMFSHMVGRSHECDFPDSVKQLPVCTSPKFGVEGSSLDIDLQVRRIVSESLSVYRVDADLLDRLEPSHIFTQSQCEVCAVSLRDVEEAVCKLVASQPQVVSLQPDSLEDVFGDIASVAEALGVVAVGEQLILSLKQRIDDIACRASTAARRRLLFIEWIDPLMAGGNWMPTLIEYAGGENVFGVVNKHSPYVSCADVPKGDPDVILIAPCGFDIARTLQETHLLEQLEFWQDLTAVRRKNVFVADGNQYFNRPGPRLVESLEILAELLHPEIFHFGHQGRGWVRLPGLGVMQ